MARYLFSSHDGFGLGHVRRNSLIARSIIEREPHAEVVLVSGLAVRPAWLSHPRIEVVRVPPLLKGTDGAYRHTELSFEEVLHRRAEAFRQTVERFRPDVVVVDRHPYGTAGELALGLDLARRAGSATVLGLRDVLDEAPRVREELAGRGWAGVAEAFDEILVYGNPAICDHRAEYGLPRRPRYCGWVVDRPLPVTREARTLVVTAGGGGDGRDVFELGLDLAGVLPHHRVVLVAGPYASDPRVAGGRDASQRITVLRDVPGCMDLYARADSVLQMAGYNSTVESLAAGLRPILMPRRSPRREQAIRASRLSSLGLADVVDEGASADEVAWLFNRPRLLAPGMLEAAGIDLDGAATAAARLGELAAAVVR